MARCLWYTFAHRDNGEMCQVCGRPYHGTLWRSPEYLYVTLTGGTHGLYCPSCFSDLATARGYELMWTPFVWHVNGDRWPSDIYDRIERGEWAAMRTTGLTGDEQDEVGW